MAEGLRALREERALRTTGMTDTNKALAAVAAMQKASKASTAKASTTKTTAAATSTAPTTKTESSAPRTSFKGDDGDEYPKKTMSSRQGITSIVTNPFNNNKNKGYKASAEIVGGKYDTSPINTGNNVNLYMAQTGRRAIANYGNGVPFYETTPGSNKFTPWGRQDNRNFVMLSTTKEDTPPKEEPVVEDKGGNNNNTSSSTVTVEDYIKESETTVDEKIEETKDIAAEAKTEIAEIATTFPGAPDWVKTPEQYEDWLRSKSAKFGFKNTIATSSTGLAPTALTSGVKVTSLSG